jgi:hypothetical protein
MGTGRALPQEGPSPLGGPITRPVPTTGERLADPEVSQPTTDRPFPGDPPRSPTRRAASRNARVLTARRMSTVAEQSSLANPRLYLDSSQTTTDWSPDR